MPGTPQSAGKPPISKRERNRACHLASLLDAAEDIFARNGYEASSVADIAKAAGLAVGTVYRFFENKQALGTAVMERIAESRASNLRDKALPEAISGRSALRTLVFLRVEHHIKHGAFLRMGFELQRSLGRREPPERIRALFDETRVLTAEFFRIGTECGHWRQLEPRSLARAFDGICNEEIFAWERCGRDGGREALESSIFKTVSTLFSTTEDDK